MYNSINFSSTSLILFLSDLHLFPKLMYRFSSTFVGLIVPTNKKRQSQYINFAILTINFLKQPVYTGIGEYDG